MIMATYHRITSNDRFATLYVFYRLTQDADNNFSMVEITRAMAINPDEQEDVIERTPFAVVPVFGYYRDDSNTDYYIVVDNDINNCIDISR